MSVRAFYFIGNENTYGKEVKNLVSVNNINLEFETDFAKLVSKTFSEKPDLLFLELKDYRNNLNCMKIFSDESPFCVPVVIIIGDIELEESIKFPSNYNYIKRSNLPSIMELIFAKTTDINANHFINRGYGKDSKIMIYNTLLDLGFNASTNGTSFIKECINEIMLNHCRPSSFSSSVYITVANIYNTTPACVARCMKVAVDTAWKRKSKITKKTINGISFDDFSRCPTAKEFVYYVATKLYNTQQNQLINGEFAVC